MMSVSRRNIRSMLAKLLFATRAIDVARNLSRWRILMYHRVVDPQSIPYPLQPGMYVRPSTFHEHMHYLARHAHVLSLDELLDFFSRGAPPPKKSVVITFDDGWLDNFHHALPILDELGLPATVFLPTAFVGTTQLFWTDKLAWSLRHIRTSPNCHTAVARIRDDEELTWSMQGHLCQLLEAEPSAFAQLIDPIITWFKSRSRDERHAAVSLVERLCREFSTEHTERVFINWDEAKIMAASRITFGSHTHSHENVAEHSSELLRHDLELSLQTLRSQQLPLSPVVCYPGGVYTESSQAVFAEHGVEWAIAGVSEADFQLRPRLLDRVGIHQDVAATPAAFAARIWANSIF